MDGGPFRSGRPAERRVASRPEQAYRQPEEPQPATEAPKPVHRAPVARHQEKEKPGFFKRFLWPLIAVVVILVGVGGWFVWSNMSSGPTGIDGSKYQAVFFSNGQSYFGKLQAFNGGYMKLKDVFYLKTQSTDKNPTNSQAAAEQNSSDMQLIKLGDEIHGPEDELIIAKDQILYYVNLKSDGKVAQAIKKFHGSN